MAAIYSMVNSKLMIMCKELPNTSDLLKKKKQL